MDTEAASTVERDYDEYRAQGRILGKLAPERIKKLKFPRYSQAIRDRFLAIGGFTSVVSDVMDALGIEAAVGAHRLAPRVPGRRIVGTAITMRNIRERKTAARSHTDKGAPKVILNDVFLLAEPGDVLICDGGGNEDLSNLGGNACMVAQALGMIGAVVSGGVRDIAEMAEIDFPVWSSGVSPTTGRMRIQGIEVNGPVTIEGVTVEPGDLVLADDDGVVFIPAQYVDAVLKGAEEEEVRAQALRSKLLVKPSIEEVRAILGVPKPASK